MENKVMPFVAVNNANTTPEQPVGYLTGGGSGGGIGLEIRVTRLENDVKEIRDTLHRLEPLLTRIDERMKHTPTTIGFVIMILTVFGLGIAVPQINNVINRETNQAAAGVKNEPQGSNSQGQTQGVH